MKKTLKFLALALCILPCVILLTACGEPKIRNVYTKLGSDSSISRNMGGFKYTTDANQPALQELNKLSIDFRRYKERWDKLSRSIEAVSRDANDIHITTDKIAKRFEAINNVDTSEMKNLGIDKEGE